MTDKVRETMRWLWVATVTVALLVWAITAFTRTVEGEPSPVSLESLLPLIGPLTAALGITEGSNGIKRLTYKPQAEAEAERIRAEANKLNAEAEIVRKNGG